VKGLPVHRLSGSNSRQSPAGGSISHEVSVTISEHGRLTGEANKIAISLPLA
jgi:hypothetical protein